MSENLFSDYWESADSFINIVNVINAVLGFEKDEHFMGISDDLLPIIGNPEIVGINDDGLNIVDFSKSETLISLAERCAGIGYDMLGNFQREVIDSLYSAIQLYHGDKMSATATVGFVQMIYAGILLVFEKSLLYFSSVFDSKFTMHDYENWQKGMIDLIDRTLAFNQNVKLQEDTTNKKHTEELEKLRHEALRMNKKLGHEIAKAQKASIVKSEEIKKYERDRVELTSLRELIFQYQNNEEEPPEPDIEFPIRTTKNIYSLGGLPSWINKMKELAPDVKYLSSDQNIRLDNKLDKADEIWFQIHGLSHAQYYSATAIADKNGIPCKYFIRQSPANCAAQLIKQ